LPGIIISIITTNNIETD